MDFWSHDYPKYPKTKVSHIHPSVIIHPIVIPMILLKKQKISIVIPFIPKHQLEGLLVNYFFNYKRNSK